MALFITRYFHAVRFPNHSLYHSAPIWSTPSHDVITDGFCVGGPLVFRNKRYDFVCIIFMKFQNFHKNFEFTCTLVPCCTPSVLWCSCWFKVIQGGLTLCTPLLFTRHWRVSRFTISNSIFAPFPNRSIQVHSETLQF